MGVREKYIRDALIESVIQKCGMMRTRRAIQFAAVLPDRPCSSSQQRRVMFSRPSIIRNPRGLPIGPMIFFTQW